MIKCLNTAMLCAILVAGATIAVYAADPTPPQTQTQTPPQVATGNGIPYPSTQMPASRSGPRPSSISRRVPARRSKAATTRRRASVRKPTKARRAGPREAGSPPRWLYGDQERQHRLCHTVAGRVHSALPKAAVQVLLLGFGIEPALLLGEPVYQHVDERAHLGGQMPAMGIERIDFALLRPVAGQQRHQRSRGQ